MIDRPPCDHSSGKTSLMVGGMWGTAESFCDACGACLSKPDIPPRPESIRKSKQFAEQMRKAAERIDAMTPEEHKAWKKEVLESLRKAREQMKQTKLRPKRGRKRWRLLD